MSATDPPPEGPPVPLTTRTGLAAACADDPLCLWVAQGMTGGVRAWTAGGAVAVASPGLARRDRLTVHGPATAVTALVSQVVPLLPPGYRLMGDAALVSAVAERLPGLEPSGTWGWMDATATGASRAGSDDGATWLEPHELETVTDLLDTGFPDSLARPGHSGVHRWAGVRDSARRLVAVAADAWSAPTVGFMAGVAVHPHARGQGLARVVCSFVTRELLAAHGRVALMVNDWNTAAIRTYEQLGFTWRALRSARITAPHTAGDPG